MEPSQEWLDQQRQEKFKAILEAHDWTFIHCIDPAIIVELVHDLGEDEAIEILTN